MRVDIAELLLSQNRISPHQRQEALRYVQENGGPVGRALVTLGFIQHEEILKLLARRYGVPYVKLDQLDVDPATIRVLPAETAWEYRVLPLRVSGRRLSLAVADPANLLAIDEIRFMTGHHVEPVVACEWTLDDAIKRYFGSTRPVEPHPGPTSSPGAGGCYPPRRDEVAAIRRLPGFEVDLAIGFAGVPPVGRLVHDMLVESVRRGASAIHVEPHENKVRVRLRVDGALHEFLTLPAILREPLTRRIKLMARLDVVQQRLPQEGRIGTRMKVDGESRDVAFRVSVQPTVRGETIVLRLFDQSKLVLDLACLGLESSSLERFRSAITRSRGIVVVAGPAGSGRTTTLYSALASLNRPEISIVTTESPAEYVLPGISQIQIDQPPRQKATAAHRCGVSTPTSSSSARSRTSRARSWPSVLPSRAGWSSRPCPRATPRLPCCTCWTWEPTRTSCRRRSTSWWRSASCVASARLAGQT